MKARVSRSKRMPQRAQPRIVSGEQLRGRGQEISDTVARRAYEIFERRGRADGHHEDDWRQAESELVLPLKVTVADAGRNLTIEAAVPGFSASEIEVGLGPRRVTIAGQRQAGDAPRAECRAMWVFRAMELPEDVDTGDATVTFDEGVLEVTLRKVAPPDAKRVS
jgi:HSP20 family molecular chaperone IbpA